MKDREHFTAAERIDPRTGKVKTDIIYTGVMYAASVSPDAFKGLKRRGLVFSALCAGFYIFAGAQNGLTGRNIFTALPYAVLSLPLAFLLIAAVRLAMNRDGRFTAVEKRKVVERMRMCGTAAAILGGWCAAAGLVLSLTNGFSAPDAAFAGATLACAAWGFAAFWEARAVDCRESS